MKIASRISKIEASKTLQVKEKALELRGKGLDVVDLTAGEPDFNTPDYVCDGGIEAIRSGFTKYTANTGIPELRQKISQKLKEENNLDYKPEQIIVSNGAKQAVLNALFAVVDDEDEVIVAAPYWVSYPEQIKIAGGKPVIIATAQNNFKITPELLQTHISAKTKALILNSPANPTGVVYTEKELTKLAEILANKDIWIISDEIYEKIIFDGLKHVSILSYEDFIKKGIIINGFSKSHAMTGWRIGYAAGPVEVIKAMSKIQSHYTSNASSISQKAALSALTKKTGAVEEMRIAFEERRNYIQSILDQKPYFSYVLPNGAFYFFIKISAVFGCRTGEGTITGSVAFSSYVTENYHVVTVPGAAFGADEYIRLSFATSRTQLEKGMTNLTRAMEDMLKMK